MNFEQLKASRQKSHEQLTEKLKNVTKSTNQEIADPRQWFPGTNKDGTGYAVVRFLPAPGEEESPFIRWWKHNFKGDGGWLNDYCPTTIGLPCPVCDYNKSVYDTSGYNSIRKRHIAIMTNVYIVQDPQNPKNNGSVKLWRFGEQVWKKISDKIDPQIEGIKKVVPWDLWDGCNFICKITTEKKGGKPQRDYTTSEWDVVGPLLTDEKLMENIWKQEYSLKEFFDTNIKIKSYDVLKALLAKATREFNWATGNNETQSTSSPSLTEQAGVETKEQVQSRQAGESSKPAQEAKVEQPVASVEKTVEQPVLVEQPVQSASGEDPELAFYKTLL